MFITQRLPLFFFLICVLAISSSCTRMACGANKSAFLEQYYELLEEAKSADLAVSDPKWETYDEAFRSYVEECYDIHEPEMTGTEKRRFWSQSLRDYYQRYGDGLAKELSGKDKQTFRKIQEEAEAILDEPNELLDNTFKGLKRDWKKLKERFKE